MEITGLGPKTAAGAGTGGLVGSVQNGSVTIRNSFFAGTYPSGSTVIGLKDKYMSVATFEREADGKINAFDEGEILIYNSEELETV